MWWRPLPLWGVSSVLVRQVVRCVCGIRQDEVITRDVNNIDNGGVNPTKHPVKGQDCWSISQRLLQHTEQVADTFRFDSALFKL